MSDELPVLGHSAPPVPILPVSQKQPAVVKEIIITKPATSAPVSPKSTSSATAKVKKASDVKRTFIPRPTAVYRKVQFTAKQAAALAQQNLEYRQGEKDVFRIDYLDSSGAPKVFLFDLLPAIENRASNKMGSIEVPEAKPGILRRIDTKHKNIIIPGGTPVVQSIGIDKALLNLVGCFTGADEAYEGKSIPRAGQQALDELKDNTLMSRPGQATDPNDSAIKASKKFYEDVVIPMTQVTVTIQSSNGPDEGVERLVYKGVIVTFKDYVVRQNKTFYTIDLLITEYPKPKESVLPQLNALMDDVKKAAGFGITETSSLESDMNTLRAFILPALNLQDKAQYDDIGVIINNAGVRQVWDKFDEKYLLKEKYEEAFNNKRFPIKKDGEPYYTTQQGFKQLIEWMTSNKEMWALRSKGGGPSTTPSNTTTGSKTSAAPEQPSAPTNNAKEIEVDLNQVKKIAASSPLKDMNFLDSVINTSDNPEYQIQTYGGRLADFYEAFINKYKLNPKKEAEYFAVRNQLGGSDGKYNKRDALNFINNLRPEYFIPR